MTDEAASLVAVVAGAGGDLGQAIAKRFASAGIQVAAITRNQAAPCGETFHADLTDPAAAKQVMDEIAQRYGRLDIYIHAVGAKLDKLALATKPQECKNIIQANLASAFYCATAAAKHMLFQKSGVILNLSSLAAHSPNTGQAAYASAKAGLEGLTRALAVEWAPKNIRVLAIAPGFMHSKMVDTMSPQMREKMLASIPLQRWGGAEDVANLAFFLSSNQANYVTGQVVQVDGGLGM